MQKLWIVGAGGFSREVAEVVRAINAVAPTWELAGFADDAPESEHCRLLAQRGYTVCSVDQLLKSEPGAYALSISNGAVKQRLDTLLTAAGWEPATLVHPDTSIGPTVILGPGSIACAGVRAPADITCGRHVHLNLNVTIGHDSTLEDYVSVHPLTAISGWARIGTRTMLGTCSTILQNVTVGADVAVGAGACVVRDIPSGVTVKGIPAR